MAHVMRGRPKHDVDRADLGDTPEVELVGLLAEFRAALRQEIEASRRANGSAAVPLVNGRRIGQLGSAYQYLFEVDNVLNLPGDAPGDLMVAGRRPLEVTVIAIEGLSITLSVGADLGAFVPSARLQSNLAHLMRKLIERLEAMRDLVNDPGDRILALTPVEGSRERIIDPALNDKQREAVESTLGRDTTFIWGPPGTGKTKTIGAIGGHMVERDASVLVVSHTNTAVDQALLQIAQRARDIDPELITSGKILRVGEPRDQRVKEDAELLCATHVDRRSEELVARRDAATAARTVAVDRVSEVGQLLDIAEWLAISAQDIAAMGRDLDDLHQLEVTSQEVREEATRRESERPSLEAQARAANDANVAMTALATDGNALSLLEGQVEAARRRVDEIAERLALSQRVRDQAVGLEPMRVRLEELPPYLGAKDALTLAKNGVERANAQVAGTEESLAETRNQLAEAESVGGLARRWRRLPTAEVLTERIVELEGALASAHAVRRTAGQRAEAAQVVFSEIEALTAIVQGHDEIPRPPAAEAHFEALENEASEAKAQLTDLDRSLTSLRDRVAESKAALARFADSYAGEPAELEAEALRQLIEIDAASQLAGGAWRDAADARANLEGEVRERLATVRDWGLTRRVSGRAEEMVAAINEAVGEARSMVAGQDIVSLRAERETLQDEIRALDATLEEISEQLERVEEVVISEAMVVATTLTRAYLRDSVWNRTFDTVILDEASMAPIPALWAVASRSERGTVVVGDFLQLPPIVIAREDEAERWLGRDVFTVSGLADRKSDAPYFVALERQYRMHPAVSAISNELFYEGHLVDDQSASSDSELDGWYRRDWGFDEPVLLVDTGPTNAWVTSVARGSGSSRLNFLSATICVDLAERFLEPDRAPFQLGDQPRVVIICPYRPHAQLLELLIRDQGLSGEVVAGTAHIFQGTEAPVVILDLVNDDPHWRVGMFRPDVDEATKRILNVAVTRARRRLVVVGDFDYMARLSKKAFFGKEFLRVLQARYPKVSALDVVPVGLGVRAAKAQSAASGGDVEADRDRLVVTQEHFYPLLRNDLANAKERVVIYSPFLTENRIAQLHTSILAAVERGVRVFVVTKTITDRNERDKATYRALNRTLMEWGVVIVPKAGMHEKLVFVDDDIIWVGSLNPLSFSNTQETMERRKSTAVSSDYAKTIRLSELVREYRDGRPSCPICRSEMIATEGRDDPYYWKCCQPDCYTRSIDEPPIGDEILCHSCGAAVAFGKWGEADAWRCVENSRHRQNVGRTHLRLPKMQAIVPPPDLRRLAKKWNIELETEGTPGGRLF